MKTILGQDIGPETDIEGALSLAGQMAHEIGQKRITYSCFQTCMNSALILLKVQLI